MQNTLKIIAAAMEAKVPWIFEHPASSYFFDTDEFKKLSRHHAVETLTFDQCFFKTEYRKRTRLVGFNLGGHF